MGSCCASPGASLAPEAVSGRPGYLHSIQGPAAEPGFCMHRGGARGGCLGSAVGACGHPKTSGLGDNFAQRSSSKFPLLLLSQRLPSDILPGLQLCSHQAKPAVPLGREPGSCGQVAPASRLRPSSPLILAGSSEFLRLAGLGTARPGAHGGSSPCPMALCGLGSGLGRQSSGMRVI